MPENVGEVGLRCRRATSSRRSCGVIRPMSEPVTACTKALVTLRQALPRAAAACLVEEGDTVGLNPAAIEVEREGHR